MTVSDDDLKYVSEQVTYSIPIPFSNGYLTSFEIRELARELLERRKADRWIREICGNPRHRTQHTLLQMCGLLDEIRKLIPEPPEAQP